ncbi:MAG: PKD domain-containing protein, partial [Bacteroidota bacterium]|nr:PKD domain-containing protein [Bacteroidota bacterium]
TFAQREAENWYFGIHAGLNFKQDTPTVLTNGALATLCGCATISDVNGNLLFYASGKKIWNKNHTYMTNGTGLLGELGNQPIIIVPLPGSSSIYYLFTIKGAGRIEGLCYSIVDMNLQNGLGEVISKNNFIYNRTTGGLTAVKHSDNTSVWIITHKLNSNAYYAHKLSNAGLDPNPVISYTGTPNIAIYDSNSNIFTPSSGYLKVSPNGKKIASIIYDTNEFNSNYIYYNPHIDLLDFNTNTGVLLNSLSITGMTNAGAVEFSPNGSKLYISANDSDIFQFDLNAGSDSSIINSGKLINSTSGTSCYSFISDIQVAINGKLYVGEFGRYHISVINDPNNADTACHFEFHSVSLGGGICKSGFPSFIQSYFFKPFFNAVGTCYEDTTFFTLSDSSHIDSLIWCFDDSLSGSRDTSTSYAPFHIFTDTGIYDVSLIVFYNGLTDTTIRDIRISLYPTANFTINDNAQCLSSNNFVFTDSSSISAGSYTLAWDFGDSSSAYIDTVSHSYLTKGNFNVKLTVLSDYGCERSKTKNVNIYFPSTDFTISDRTQCLNENLFNFVADTINNPDTTNYYWDLGDSTTSTSKLLNHNYLNADTFLVTLIVKYDSHCIDTGTKNIYVNPSPQAN